MDHLQFIKAQLIAQIEAYQVQNNNEIATFQLTTNGQFALLSWLKAQPHFPQFYLNIRDGSCLWVGVGQVRSFSAVDQAEKFVQQQHLTLLGGVQFYGKTEFILPRILLCQRGSALTVSVFISQRDFAQDKQQALDCLATFEQYLSIEAVSQSLTLVRQKADQSQWLHWVEQGLMQIKQGRLSKIVLANESIFATSTPLNAIDFLYESQRHNLGCYHFLYAKSADSVFLGSTPELLYRRQNQQLKTEALAGTALMTDDVDVNEQQSQWLLNDPKNEYENQLVVNGICEQLTPFVSDLTIAPVELKKLRQVQHLRRKIQATLNTNCGDKCILSAIHPTAAIAGLPQQVAKSAVQKIENFDRTWYAGTLGVMSVEQADFCVTIRSAFVEQFEQHSQLRVFAGAGIVEGSDPVSEWKEIERKATSLLSLLQHQA